MNIDTSKTWKFEVKNPRSKARDPIQGEFWNTEDIKTMSVALIRESFQNSLDSNIDKKIRVRVTVSGQENALSAKTAGKYFLEYWDHLKGAYPEFKVAISEMAEKKCEFVVIEDFGTTGLMGDEKAHSEPLNKKNDFYYFFRAEGKSGKSGNSKGRWGIGKYIFPKSSNAKTFFALTIRHEGPHPKGPLLMGQAVIKGHEINGNSFEPDGWFAVNGENVYEPFDSNGFINEFKSDWKISRTSESGLSVVIPYIEDVNEGDLFRSVIEEYMLVILRDQLEVELVGSSKIVHILNSQNLRIETERIFAGRDEKNEVLANLDAFVWANGVPDGQVVKLNQVSSSPEWNNEIITEQQATIIRERLDSNQRVIVRVPVKIQVKGSDGESDHNLESHFDVLYVAGQGNIRAQFIREGIKVSGVRGGTISSLRSITLIDSGIMATLLGDAEGPAHTSWDSGSEKLGKKYKYTAKWIEFVKNAPRKIIESARGADREGDRIIAAGWFPDVAAGRTPLTGAVTGPKTGEDPSHRPIPLLPQSRPKVRTLALVDGFSISLTEEGYDVTAIECKCAYDTRKGNAFRKWTPDDFNLKKMPLEVIGGSLTKREGNVLVVQIENPAIFVMHVRGFDLNRDVSTTTRVAV